MVEIRVRTRIPQVELEEKIGKLLTDADHNLRLTGPAKVLKPDGTLLCIYLPGAVDMAMDAAYPLLTKIRGTTDNRGHASGTPTRRGGAGKKRTRSKPITSTILGSIDGAGFGEESYCRLTAYTAKQAEGWPKLVPLWQAIADRFAEHVPARFQVQAARARVTEPEWVIPGTPFTTITVNSTYPTGVHTDKGDLEAGFSCLAVARRRALDGGRLTFPEYRVAVDLQHGDLLLMDAHEYHGNTPITCTECDAQLDKPGHVCPAVAHQAGPFDSPERISVVCYYRAAMASCGSLADEDAKRAAVAQRQTDRALNRQEA
jgi:hypothetical protein